MVITVCRLGRSRFINQRQRTPISPHFYVWSFYRSLSRVGVRKKTPENRCSLCWDLMDAAPPPVYIPRPSSRVRGFCLPSLSSHFLPSCLLRTSKGLSWLSVSSWWKPPSSHYCLMCAKRPAHKRPAGGPNFHFPPRCPARFN